MTRWFRAGLLGAVVLVAPAFLSAQSRQGFHPSWERTGLDFRPNGGWRKKGELVSRTRANLLARGDMNALNAPLAGGMAPSSAALTGALRVPVIPFSFQNSANHQPFSTAQLTASLFGATGPVGRPYSLLSFYEQMSNGVFRIEGDVANWVRLKNPEVSYVGTPGTCPQNPTGTGNCNGTWSGTATSLLQTGLVEAIDSVDATVNFAQYDNDGPDGIPNSGDDDGLVDVVMFLHAEQDGACWSASNNHPWAHRFFLTAGNKTTNDARLGGGFIQISDYYIQSGHGGVSNCTVGEVLGPGTAAHELGHALGLPDLYDTQGQTEGIGQWGLMGSGNYTTGFSPSRMEAWSLNEMGWVAIRTLSTAGTYTLGPAPSSDTAFMIRPVGPNPRGQYWLVENRQPVHSDSALVRIHCGVSGNPAGCGGGLLIWHVDSVKMNQGGNALNAGAIHGLELDQADGLNNLRNGTGGQPGTGGRGDAGDLWPGVTNKTVFGPSTTPAARLNGGGYANGAIAGFQLDQIAVNGGVATLRLSYAAPVVITTTAELPGATMGSAYQQQLAATGGLGEFTWTVTAGALPAGLVLSNGGVLSGTPTVSGNFNFTVQAASGGNQSTLAATLAITQPTLTSTDVVTHILSGASALSPADLTYLDLLGNRNGGFDLGDFLAWVNATGAVGALRELETAQRHQTSPKKEK
jgi:M6 family metalloprotease-like protein